MKNPRKTATRLNKFDKALGVDIVIKDYLTKIGAIESETNEEIETIDNIYELQKFMPIILEPTTQSYISKLLANMGAKSDFYNNAILNLSHYYIFCVHCMLVKIYKHVERIEFLDFIKKTADYFDKHKIDLEKLQHYAFNMIERDAIKFLFHMLKIDSTSDIYRDNTEIFNLRNEIAHFNEKVISAEQHEKILNHIVKNLTKLSEKMYPFVKDSLFVEINSLLKKALVDDSNYSAYLEEINRKFYITPYDYEILYKNIGQSTNLRKDKKKPNYYILKYATEYLSIE
ncbi:MAG: hypothetical protein A2Y40_10215 [Candidatus Margulisbacteria bacterium GWF2_35_9]|nr:MAG: hypothetical protein A2Y40_10215 [Candidatus Margulisbacteria bacterium GWF2_35_9]